MSPPRDIDLDGLEARIETLPGLAEVRAAGKRCGVSVYVVGGAVRDALIGTQPLDLDLVVIGDPLELAEALEGEIRAHERFCTATVEAKRGRINIAAARSETYAAPGSLPDIRLTGEIEADLGRRDFTVNAIAVAVDKPGVAIDPHGGVQDLRDGVLRALHPASFVDDPTRALRAARYTTRIGLEVAAQTMDRLRETDLSTVSGDRVEAELLRLAAETKPRPAFEMLAEWGLLHLTPDAGQRIDAAVALIAAEPWADIVDREELVLAASREPSSMTRELAASHPPSPSSAVDAASGHEPITLALARVIGAEWLDRYVCEWSRVQLEISGADLLAAGVVEGPAVGRGLAAALRAKLDGKISRREDELRSALDVAAEPAGQPPPA